MDKRRLSVYLMIGFLLGSAGIVVATHLSNTSTVSDGVPLGAPDGMNATITGETQAQLEQHNPDSSTVRITTEDGNISFSSNGPAWATVHKSNITGTWTRVSAIDATSNDITIDPEDKESVTVGKDIDSISFKSAAAVGLDDGTVDFIYAGSSGTSKVSISGVPADTRIAAIDKSTGNILDESTSNSNGRITFDDLDNSEHSVELQSFDPSAPTFSNPSPTGDLDSNPSEISVDVNDSDFPRGDIVNVTISLDGTEIHNESITANQTVSTTMPDSGQTGGSHDWTVEATDDYGESRVETYSYNVPDTLYIRNETNHSQLIDTPTDVTAKFVGDNQIYTRNTSDGTINMTDLPVNQDFIVEISTDGNYTERTAYIQTIYEQQSVYLLNTSTYNTIESRFVLDDPTGQYGPSTVMYIQKPINTSSKTTWQTIEADKFGVEGVTAVLQEDIRYRIKIENQEGTSQIVGPYRSDVGETVTVRPGNPSIELGEYQDGWAANAELENVTLQYTYSDPHKETDSVTVWIYEKNNKSNKLQPNETYFDLGNFSAQKTLTENESEKTWVVAFVIDRGGSETTYEKTVSNKADLVPDLSREWRLITAIMLLVLLGSAFSVLNRAVGAVTTAMVGGILYYTGWLSGATTGVMVTLTLFIAIGYATYVKGGP